MKHLKGLLLNILIGTMAIALAAPAWAALGDNAPPIPATYKTSHPRLPVPDSTYLTSLANNATVLASYNTTADQWDSTNPSPSWQLRRLLIAYMANKIANPTKAATYLTKIKALADLGGSWGKLEYSVNDGAGNGTYTVTSSSANFLTGCGGSSCAGNFLSIQGRTYTISSVPNANTLVLSQSNPAPTGSNLKFRVLSSLNDAGINIAIIYDWLYNDLDAATRTEFMNELDVLCTEWEENYIGLNASPYNDVFYNRLGTFGLLGALAIYPDHPNSTKHMNFMTDVWFNVLLPVWKQVFGPEGGGWHENWSDYVRAASGNGLDTYLVPSLLSWQVATGDPILTRESWVKNFAYFTMYMTRPDYLMESTGDASRAYIVSESPSLCSLSGLAEIYNDPVIRGWARFINSSQPSAALDGFEPSTWPFYKPDNKSNPVSDRSALPAVRNFTGWGELAMRTGWSEDDTAVTLKYGPNFWSHEHFDSGAFTIFSRGLLALDSGTYRAGSNSKHQMQYGKQTIAHNTLTITDPADVYPTTFTGYDEGGNTIQLALPNDGGQRRAGTLYNEHFPQFSSPNNIGDWLRNWDYYHMGKMVAFANTPNYTYTAVDITNAYNNKYSASTPNASNRTYRVQKAVRHLIMIPRGTSAYVIVYDQVTSTNASFVKRWLLHTVNKPTITGNRFEVVRNELVTSLPYVSLWPYPMRDILKYDVGAGASPQYQYDGKLYGWAVQPQGVQFNVVGGPGKEFWVEDPLKPGTGTNWNQCMAGQCAANTEGLGPVENYVNPDPKTAPHEPGSWRIEEMPGTPATQDFFLNVMLATTVEDTNVPANVTAPASLPAGMAGATWTEGGKTYTLTLPKDGTGGHITISGVVDEDLLAHAQQLPDTMQVQSGNSQSAAAGSQLPAPLVVTVKDSAGNAVPNAAVHFGITQGSGRLSSDMVMTDGQGSASVNLILGAGATGSLTVMADVNGLAPVQFNATPGSGGASSTPALTTLSCAPASLNSGASATCTVTLSQAASGSVSVTLASNKTGLTVPATVSVSSGATTATFPATASTISTADTAVVTATLNGASQTASVALVATVPAVVALSSVSCSPSSVGAGASVTCTVTLSQAAAGSAVTVSLSSNTQLISVPATVSVAAGSTTASFTASAGAITASQTAVITAALNSSSQTASLSLTAVSSQGNGSTGGTPLPNGVWTMVKTHGIPAQIVGYEKIVYAPDPVKKILMRSNYHNLGTEPNQGLIAYDFETNQWSALDVGESFHSENMPEGGHSVGGFAFNPNQNTILYYCCASGSNQGENPYGMWWYDFFGQVGRSKQTSPKPGTTQYETSAFDPGNNLYVLQGGNSFVGTWTYNPGAGIFTQQTPGGTPPNASVNQAAMTYNSNDHKIYLFGGQIGAGFSNDLYAYDVAANTWTKLNPTGTPPSPRWRTSLAYDSTNNIFMVYGGQDATQTYNDTWIYNPATNTWTQLTSAGTPPMDDVGPFENLAYDSDHNAFVLVLRGTGGYADGAAFFHSAQTWMFRYQGSGQNPGTASASFTTTPGGINQNTDAWAKEPSLASSGTALYTAWVETGRPYDTTNNTWFHVYAKQMSANGAWSQMGNSPGALDSEWSSYSESHSPSISVVAGTPWVSWYKWNNAGQVWGLWAKSWNGSAWQGGPVGRVGSDPARAFQGRSQMIDVGGVPYIAFLEVNKTFLPQKTFVYVKYWDGTQWTLKGSGPLNISSANTVASSISIATDGTVPYVAWTEYTTDNLVKTSTPPQVYVAKWNGSGWTTIGTSLNVNPANWADDASITFLGGQPYVAWTEKTVAGNSQLFVKTLTGGNWTSVGSGPLNKDSNTGWAFRPALVADNSSNTLNIAWVEQQGVGKRAQTYVAQYKGGTWTALGGSLNVNPTLGSAQRVSLAVVAGQPVAAWGEVNFGSLRQVYAKQWNGSAWTLLTGSAVQSVGSPCDLNTDGAVNSQDVQLAINQALGVAPCTSADLMQSQQCNVIDVQRVIAASLGGACRVGP